MDILLLAIELDQRNSFISNHLLGVQLRVLLRVKKRGYRLFREGVLR